VLIDDFHSARLNMNDGGSSLPVNIDVSANAEFKAEIPATSMGRTLDALTDLIRPFTESRGLKADRIRLQREDVLIEIAQRARARMAVEQGEIKPIPLRVIVPLLEKASLADPNDETLIEAWTSLLQSASLDENANHGLFIDVLSKLDPAHLKLLEFLMTRDDSGHLDAFMFINRHEAEQLLIGASETVGADTEAKDEDIVEKLNDEMLAFFEVNGCVLLGGGIHFLDETGQGPYYEFGTQIDLQTHPEALIDALAGVNILERTRIQFDHPRFHVWLVYVSMTVFGLEMYECCHRPQHSVPE